MEWNNGTGRRKVQRRPRFLKRLRQDHCERQGHPVPSACETSIMIAKQPLVLTNHVETFDIQVNVHGGGESGQASATRHGITRALITTMQHSSLH